MQTIHFKSRYHIDHHALNKSSSLNDEAAIKNEPMFFNCTTDYAHENGGAITRRFLDALPGEYQKGIIDTRVHMLMEGWYPCIPGWHHDDVPRNTPNGQPNYVNPEYRAKHVMALVNGDIAPTEFAFGDISLEIPEGVIYKTWHTLVEEACQKGLLARAKAPSDSLIFFDWQSFHQGTPAIKSGWRWFGRVSIDTHRIPTNEVRKQTQVYLANPMAGW